MITDFQTFRSHFDIPPDIPTYSEWLEETKIFCVKKGHDLHTPTSWKKTLESSDPRVLQFDDIFRKMYDLIVLEPESFLERWFTQNVALSDSPESYLYYNHRPMPLVDETIDISGAPSTGRLVKNIHWKDFFETGKYDDSFLSTISYLKKTVEDRKIANLFVWPSGVQLLFQDDWVGFGGMERGVISKPSIFNPHNYSWIIRSLMPKAKNLFAPCMAWNAYQHAFYNTDLELFVGTDVIPNLVWGGEYLQRMHESNVFAMDKHWDLFNCPSEKLSDKFQFDVKYRNQFDCVLFSPPYFNLELYPGENQSTTLYPEYSVWLKNYWEATVDLCRTVLKPGGTFGFVISDFTNMGTKDKFSISDDLKTVASKYFVPTRDIRIKWKSFSTRTVPKQSEGNFENLYLLEKQ